MVVVVGVYHENVSAHNNTLTSGIKLTQKISQMTLSLPHASGYPLLILSEHISGASLRLEIVVSM